MAIQSTPHTESQQNRRRQFADELDPNQDVQDAGVGEDAGTYENMDEGPTRPAGHAPSTPTRARVRSTTPSGFPRHRPGRRVRGRRRARTRGSQTTRRVKRVHGRRRW